MLSVFLSINMILSITVLLSNHPLSLGLVVFIQTFIVSMLSSYFTPTNWFSLILFLILIGALLILFMYMTNVASNNKFKKSNFSFLLMPLIIFLLLNINKFYFLNFHNYNNMPDNFTMKFMNTPSMFIIILMMTYLFITLVASVKIISFKNYPFRLM